MTAQCQHGGGRVARSSALNANSSAACRGMVGRRLKLCPCLFGLLCGGVVLFCALLRHTQTTRLLPMEMDLHPFASYNRTGRQWLRFSIQCAVLCDSASEALPKEKKSSHFKVEACACAAITPRCPPPRTPSSGIGRCSLSRPARSAPACPRRSPCRPRRRPRVPCR